MTNKEKVLDYMIKISENITYDGIIKNKMYGINADDLSKKLDISRANISSILNELVRENHLVKIISRPVYFLTRKKAEELLGKVEEKNISIDDFNRLIKKSSQKHLNDVFEDLIGYKGGLKKQVEQAKAAVLYPPYGLHTLIIGPPGSGKSYLADLMYKHWIQIGKSGNYETLNCADYYNNPQLLMSYLFGHIKGAFTGADSDNVGLVEKANGGILFLDEVHRLPPEGQEMLFYLIDKGIYHRLGDTSIKKANLMIISATTEDPDSSLLKTFLRRIPIVIKMPGLKDRPTDEKVEIIKRIFKEEAKRINKKLFVFPEVITILLNHDFEGNVGELKSTIQLLSAKSFLKSYSELDNDLRIDIELMPDYIKHKDSESKQSIIYDDSFVILPDGEEKIIGDYNLYDTIAEKYKILEQQGFSKSDITESIGVYIDKYYRNTVNRFKSTNLREIGKLVDKNIIDLTSYIKDFAESKLNIKLNDNFLFAFSFHLEALIKRIKNGQQISNARFNEVRIKFANEYKVAEEIVNIIKKKFRIDIPKDETGFITLFLVSGIKNIDEKKCVAIMVLMHGDGAAKNISSVVNKLLNISKVSYFDMPLSMDVDEAYVKVINISKEINEGKGILYLVDMGSLKDISKIVENITSIKSRVIDNVSTPLVLEAARKSYFLNEDIDEIYYSILNDTLSYIDKTACIITICSTGEGTADKLKEYIEENYNLNNVNVYSLGIYDIMDKSSKYFDIINNNKVICVIGAMDPKIENVPFISADIIIKDRQYLYNHFNISIKNYSKGNEEYEEIKNALEEFLTYINPMKVINSYKIFINEIEKYNIKLNRDKKIKLGVHIGCVVERIFTNNFIKHYNKNEIINNNNELFQILKSAITVFNKQFNINISDDEICFIIDIINYDNVTSA